MRPIHNMLAWQAIVAVADCASFRDAAVRLDTDVSAVSRLVTAVETEVGHPFFDRKARPVRLTAYGENALVGVRELVSRHERLVKALTTPASALRRTLRFGIVSGYPRAMLLEMIADFQLAHPTVDIEVVGDVDHLDLIRGRVDAAYLLYEPDAPELSSHFVAKIGVLPVASQAYVERFGMPETPEDLARHTVLQRVSRNYPKSDTLVNGLARRPLRAAHMLSGDFLTIKSALFASLGIAVDLPTYSLREGLQSGEIVPVLGPWRREPFMVSIVTRRADESDPALDAFVTWFVERERKAVLERFEAVGLPFEAKRHSLGWR